MSKKVVLVGDSIRIGYEGVVRAQLNGVAEVVSAEQNGGDSRRVLESVEAWAVSEAPDVVHVNCGLHDLNTPFDTGEARVPLAEYKQNVMQILEALKAGIKGTVIWAYTTPVNQTWHHERKPFDRFEADVLAYNSEAVSVCDSLGIVTNDLYAVVMEAGRDDLLGPDGVHFGEEGYRVLGEAAAKAIRKHL